MLKLLHYALKNLTFVKNCLSKEQTIVEYPANIFLQINTHLNKNFKTDTHN